ncbi:hypothetical protein KDH_25510 [Dictyobacter sp. S3.2.2.5]|uniref:Uncharacterized protein n=1 Tax=Dictyobacter halimunensis TaxID=3026934 RepID=A0ABQ6FPR3_9CHLR|nr:hypothetical protein KDH_25510 [Dictyobacter sp. S3.2.2.5]
MITIPKADAKKHRPKARCRAIDEYATIKMRNSGPAKGCCGNIYTIYTPPTRPPDYQPAFISSTGLAPNLNHSDPKLAGKRSAQ